MRRPGRFGRTTSFVIYHENLELDLLSEQLTCSVLINDVVIIEPIVRDDLIFGVAGILECMHL
jgi:hypothetical protein